MKKRTKKLLKAEPVTTYLSEPGRLTDNELARAFKELKFTQILTKCGFRKRKGDGLSNVIFALLVWPLLSVKSISNFAGKQLKSFICGGVGVLYDFRKKEDLKWRRLRMETAKAVYKANNLGAEPCKAFVFDDTHRHRRGKKMEGASWHYDHSEGRYVFSHENLEMGLVTPKGYLPLDSQICTGQSKAVLRENGFQDNRSSVAVDYLEAVHLDKNEMLRRMMWRAKRFGFKADYVLADSWFCNKENIKEILESGYTAILRGKRGNMKYRINGRLLNATQLYFILKSRAKKIRGLPWKGFSILVELDLNDKGDWRKIKLVFTLPKDEHKGDFGLFLCTDIELPVGKILEVYALRWSIEVYFKEVKQNMGLLSDQTGNYVCHYASIHLAAIRYLLFSQAFMQDGAGNFSVMRTNISTKLEIISYAKLLWELFKGLISGALDKLEAILGESVILSINNAIGKTVTEFLEEALQIDEASLIAERAA